MEALRNGSMTQHRTGQNTTRQGEHTYTTGPSQSLPWGANLNNHRHNKCGTHPPTHRHQETVTVSVMSHTTIPVP